MNLREKLKNKWVFYDLNEGQKQIKDIYQSEFKVVVTTHDEKEYSFEEKYLKDFINCRVVKTTEGKVYLLLGPHELSDKFTEYNAEETMMAEAEVHMAEENIENWEL